jgi:hypothetical protein
MRQQPYEISDTDIHCGWNCVFILQFLLCCNHMRTSSTGEARTKQINKQGCECCLRLSQLNGGPRKISGVEGCVLQFSTLGPLSQWPWIIARYSPVTVFGLQTSTFVFTKVFYVAESENQCHKALYCI